MSEAIENVREIIEPENRLFMVLQERCQLLSEYSTFGPADLCYLVKEHKGGILSPTTRSGYFHHVYGVDCSSSASVAVYINTLIKNQETVGWTKKKSHKIIKAIFCIFDIVLRRDVRVEISIPGGTHVYAVDEENKKSPISGAQWNFVFMSSILRSFHPQPAPALVIVTELENKSLFKDFLLVATQLQKNGYGSKFGEVQDKAKIGSSILISEVANYMIGKMRINSTIEFLNPFVEDDDPGIVTYICDSLMTIDKTKDAIILLAQKIKEYPMLVPVLLKQANGFIKYEYYEYALLLAKICVDLCPESFECWMCLAETYFHMRQFTKSLVCIDIAPFSPGVDPGEEENERYPDLSMLNTTNPKVQNCSSFFPEYLITPTSCDFKDTHIEDAPSDNVDEEYQQQVGERLEKCNNRDLTRCEKDAYGLLIKIEKEITWEKLLEIKTTAFLAEQDDTMVWENPHLNADYAKNTTEDEEQKQANPSGVDESFLAIQNSAKSFIQKKQKNENKMTVIEEEKTIDGREATPDNPKKDRTTAVLREATVDDPQVTFHSKASEESDGEDEGEGEEDEPAQLNQNKKRLANKIDKMFIMLYEDLNLLIEWEQEEKKKIEEQKPDSFSYSGLIWVHRGMLAERLNRNRLAEKAYRNAVEKGFSLFTWNRLLNIYHQTFNPKACLVCIAEIFDQADDEGIEHFDKLPFWIESVLFKLIAANGQRQVIKLAKDMDLEDCEPLTQALMRAQYWEVEGYNS